MKFGAQCRKITGNSEQNNAKNYGHDYLDPNKRKLLWQISVRNSKGSFEK